MRKCECGIEITIENGTKNGKGGLNSRCKECQRKKSKQHYLDNKDRYKKNNNKRMKLLWEWLEEYKSKLSCSRCGFSGHPAVIEFHHKDRESKIACISKLLADTKNKEKVLLEIAKCDTLCANCHRIEHYREQRGK